MLSRSSIICCVLSVLCPSLLRAADPIIARYSGAAFHGGKFGYLAEVQSKLNQLRVECRPAPTLVADGLFGPIMRDAIKKAASCPDVQNSLPRDSEARNGALTDAQWAILFPTRSKPSVYERAMAIVLTQEATDFDHAEWNFCQSRPIYNPAQGQTTCYSNDPTSFLTWGPRGATAGGGGEVQRILYAVDSDPNMKAIVDDSFKATSADVRHLLRLDAKNTGPFCAKSGSIRNFASSGRMVSRDSGRSRKCSMCMMRFTRPPHPTVERFRNIIASTRVQRLCPRRWITHS